MVCFAMSCWRGTGFPFTQWESTTECLPQDLYSTFLHQVTEALTCTPEHPWFLSIYCVHLLARCILRYCFFALLHFGSWKFVWECLFFGYQGKPVLEMFGRISEWIDLGIAVSNMHSSFLQSELFKCPDE